VTGFSGEKGTFLQREFKSFKKLMGKCRGIRRLGGAALDMCYLANGTFDGFWEFNLAPWDVSASYVICSESGIEVVDMDNNAFSPLNKSFVACNPLLKKEFLRVLNQ
jgi:myo-inositol-1(or 4)-monophosphatase